MSAVLKQALAGQFVATNDFMLYNMFVDAMFDVNNNSVFMESSKESVFLDEEQRSVFLHPGLVAKTSVFARKNILTNLTESIADLLNDVRTLLEIPRPMRALTDHVSPFITADGQSTFLSSSGKSMLSYDPGESGQKLQKSNKNLIVDPSLLTLGNSAYSSVYFDNVLTYLSNSDLIAQSLFYPHVSGLPNYDAPYLRHVVEQLDVPLSQVVSSSITPIIDKLSTVITNQNIIVSSLDVLQAGQVEQSLYLMQIRDLLLESNSQAATQHAELLSTLTNLLSVGLPAFTINKYDGHKTLVKTPPLTLADITARGLISAVPVYLEDHGSYGKVHYNHCPYMSGVLPVAEHLPGAGIVNVGTTNYPATNIATQPATANVMSFTGEAVGQPMIAFNRDPYHLLTIDPWNTTDETEDYTEARPFNPAKARGVYDL